jgi:hypothetical protein
MKRLPDGLQEGAKPDLEIDGARSRIPPTIPQVWCRRMPAGWFQYRFRDAVATLSP